MLSAEWDRDAAKGEARGQDVGANALHSALSTQHSALPMRVIAGEAKGFSLKAPKGMRTRPMADKIKGALFSMLASLDIEPVHVLDLYAGSGAVGIEFLSRGAETLDSVEQWTDALAVIGENLTHTKFAAQATVHRSSVEAFLARPTLPRAFDTVMMDPPYADPQIAATMAAVAGRAPERGILPGAVLVVGHSPRVTLPEQVGTFGLLRKRMHGDSGFSIYREGFTAGDGGGNETHDEEDG